MTPWDDAAGLAVALGIGLLVGIERERRKGLEPRRGAAGLRTFALAGFSGGLAAAIGPVALAVAGAFVALMAAVGARSRRGDDAGSTTDFAMLVVLLLGALRCANRRWRARAVCSWRCCWRASRACTGSCGRR